MKKTAPRSRVKRHLVIGRYQRKTALSYIAIILLMLALLNTYPILESQQLIFRAKETELSTRARLIASSLSVLEQLTPTAVEQIISRMDIQYVSRMVVSDADGLVVSDNAESESLQGVYATQPEILRALDAKDVFACRYENGAFESRVALPVTNRGQVLGAVYLYEYDSEQAAILLTLQNNLTSISLVITLVVAVLSIIISSALSRRLGDLLRGIRLVREGEYSHRVPMRGRDELASLADEFNELTNRLQKTEATRRRFVADASHELKTPLSAIRLLADSILQNASIDAGTVREFVSDIGDESDRLSRLTGKLLTLTRLDAEVFAPVYGINVKPVVLRAASRLRLLMSHAGVLLTMELADDAVVDTNPDSLYQIVYNLIENAIKYNKPGGAVKLLLKRSHDQVVLVVEDTGVGIGEEDLPRVFERFYRVDKARSREAGGAGLGLSIVRDTLSMYGGEVHLESTPGEGTRVTVTFPVGSGKTEEGESDA